MHWRHVWVIEKQERIDAPIKRLAQHGELKVEGVPGSLVRDRLVITFKCAKCATQKVQVEQV